MCNGLNLKKGMLLAAVIAMLLIATVALAATYPFTGIVTDDTNMRSTASSYESNVIKRIPEGDTVKVTGATGNFYRIEYDGRTGYVFKNYVEKTADVVNGAEGFTAAGYPYQTVTTARVNLRKSASTSAKKLDVIPNGDPITVHKLSGEWANVTWSGTTGWVMKEYIRAAAIVSGSSGSDGNTGSSGNDILLGNGNTTYQLLQKGSDGDHVAALQEALIELGYLSSKADGVYGAGTANAVMAFQKKNDLPVTGYADVNMQALIFNGKPLNSRGTKTEVKTLSALSGQTVRSGDKGALVRSIQSMLQDKGYSVSVTGTYDSKTVTAVKAFQKKNDLKADGLCGEETQKLLFGSGLSSSATATPRPTPSPTPLPPLQTPSGTVRNGTRGNNAKLVQQRLIDLKYLEGKADGIFGAKSAAALKEFQKNNKLVADGVAGSGTNAVLFSYLALAADEKPSNLPTPTPTPRVEDMTEDNVVLIKLGVSGTEVLRLQQRLELLGYYTPVKDGKCKADDVAAIKLFQKKNGLTQDGIAGYDTQKLLYSDSAIMHNGSSAGSLTMSYETLKKGMRGENVKRMQERLIQLGYLSGTADGVFGTDTAEAVYYFQKNNGLVRDSIAGEKTLIKLFSASAVGAVTATPTPRPTPTIKPITGGTLRKGDSSDAVKTMQQKLIQLGYLSGTADGVFGNLTYKAVKEFQKANALAADGVAGSKTIAALNGTNAAPSVTDSPSNGNGAGSTVALMGRNVKYEYWYSTVRNEARKYQYATLFDPKSGISWQIHMFSFGKHAEIEPLTAADTAKMNQVCGKENWTPKPVWVIFADGTIRIATTHSVPHGVQHIRGNDFAGHSCLHFPRTQAQVTAIGPYATKHQAAVDKAWAELQADLD